MVKAAARWLLGLALCGVGWPSIALHAGSPEELFLEANRAYQEGAFSRAAELYRRVVELGIEDPAVEYNLGNAEFRVGRLGRAILHFERARRLDPTDPEIETNLRFARGFCVDRIETPEPAAWVTGLRRAQDALGPDRQVWMLVGLFWCAAALVAWCSARPGGWSAGYGWTLAALMLALAIGFTSWYTTLERIEGSRSAVVLQDVVEVLAGPGENNAALFTVHEGLLLEVRADRQEWIQVSLPNGLNGWIRRDAVGIV